jgi:Flp pilus assembly pilin Flp
VFLRNRVESIADDLGNRLAAHLSRKAFIKHAPPLTGDVKVMSSFIVSLMRDEQGQDLIEYGLLAALISILCVASIMSAGQKVSSFYSSIEVSIP